MLKVESVVVGFFGVFGFMGVGQSQRMLFYVGDGLLQILGLLMFDYFGDMCLDWCMEVFVDVIWYKQDWLFDELGVIVNVSCVFLYFYDVGGL